MKSARVVWKTYPSRKTNSMKKGTRRIPLTQGKFAIVDDCDFEWLMQWKWHAHQSRMKSHSIWYAGRNSKELKRTTVSMHYEVAMRAGLPAGRYDHVNRNGLNNTRVNIRPCTRSENRANSIKTPGFSSNYKGVCWNKNLKRWQAKINCLGVRYHLGWLRSEYQAHLAYAEAAEILFGEFARD